MKPWQRKELMYTLYVQQRKSITDIAEIFTKQGDKCSYQTIQNWLEKHDLLKLRGRGRKRVTYKGALKPATAGKPAGGFYGQPKAKKRAKPPWM